MRRIFSLLLLLISTYEVLAQDLRLEPKQIGNDLAAGSPFAFEPNAIVDFGKVWAQAAGIAVHAPVAGTTKEQARRGIGVLMSNPDFVRTLSDPNRISQFREIRSRLDKINADYSRSSDKEILESWFAFNGTRVESASPYFCFFPLTCGPPPTPQPPKQ